MYYTIILNLITFLKLPSFFIVCISFSILDKRSCGPRLVVASVSVERSIARNSSLDMDRNSTSLWLSPESEPTGFGSRLADPLGTFGGHTDNFEGDILFKLSKNKNNYTYYFM